jgi:hypothetical protein
MGKTEIIAALPHLTVEERAEIQAKLDELAGDAWVDGNELSNADRQALDAALSSYHQTPDAGSTWNDVKTRIQARLRP